MIILINTAGRPRLLYEYFHVQVPVTLIYIKGLKLKLSLCLTKYHAFKSVLCLIKNHAKKTYGEVELKLHAIITSALNEGRWSSF
jgi:hypothetical protein